MSIEASLRVRVEEVEALAREVYPAYASRPRPSVTFKYQGAAAGSANYRDNVIMLNAGQAIQSDAIARLTVPHEVAHLVCRHLYPKAKAHGPEWRMICRSLGGDGKRCYNAAERGVTVVKAKRTIRHYLYHTTVGTECWVGPIHHARLQKHGDTSVFSGKPAYYLNTATGHKVLKNGFQHKTRIKA